MTLRQIQSLFLRNVAKLILWAYEEKGYELTGGELYRPEEMQILYFEGYTVKKISNDVKLCKIQPKSKTMFSDHLKRLAIDINLFINGRYIKDGDKYKLLHDYWKTLHPNNYSGYEWGWDFNHFGMTEKHQDIKLVERAETMKTISSIPIGRIADHPPTKIKLHGHV